MREIQGTRTLLSRGRSVLAAMAVMATACIANAEELIVYGSTPADEWAVYKAAFEAANPDITLTQLHAAGNVVVARVMAEADDPQADVLFDVPATGMVLLARDGLVEPYRPANFEQIDPRLADAGDPPSWFAFSGFATVICYNRIEGEKRNIPAPTSWADLADPIYRGEITVPDPGSSGTGMMFVAGVLELLGEEEGWAYLDALHENVAYYTHSGRKPCALAGTGEHVIGITIENSAIREISGGAPIDAIVPEEGMFWEIASIGLVTGTDQPEAAKRFLDWAASREANQLYADFWSIIAIRELAKPRPHLPSNFLDDLREIDFAWVADNRERIGTEWQRRYATKIEPE